MLMPKTDATIIIIDYIRPNACSVLRKVYGNIELCKKNYGGKMKSTNIVETVSHQVSVTMVPYSSFLRLRTSKYFENSCVLRRTAYQFGQQLLKLVFVKASYKGKVSLRSSHISCFVCLINVIDLLYCDLICDL